MFHLLANLNKSGCTSIKISRISNFLKVAPNGNSLPVINNPPVFLHPSAKQLNVSSGRKYLLNADLSPMISK